MKRLFKVKLVHIDGSNQIYNIVAKNDDDAKRKAININIKEAQEDFVTVDFCEVIWVSDVDG